MLEQINDQTKSKSMTKEQINDHLKQINDQTWSKSMTTEQINDQPALTNS